MTYETVTGYCWPQSAVAGDTVGLHLSSAGARPVSIEIARVGCRREAVFSEPSLPVDDHPTPIGADRDGCGWPAAMELCIDPYLALNHLSPYAGSAGWPDWELPFISWAERQGHQVDVVTNADLEDFPQLLARTGEGGYSLYLSVGHDEYWSGPMRDTVEGFIAEGGNAAFLSGNTSFWQVRLEDPTPEGPAATMVGYKGQLRSDPVYGTDRVGELTSMWSDRDVGRPENRMTGVSFVRGGYHRIGKRATRGAGGYTIHRPDHWLFDGADVGYGGLLGATSTAVGYECDGCDFTYRDGLPYPTGADGTPKDFTILGTVPAAHFTRETATRPPPPGQPSEVEFIAARMTGGGREPDDVERISHGHAVLGTYTSPKGGVVVTSGSTDWAHGLDGRDPQIEQITRTLMNRLGGPPSDGAPEA